MSLQQTLISYPTNFPRHPTLLLFHFRSNTHSPHRRSEEPSRSSRVRIRNLDRGIQIIHIIIRDANPPPARHGRVGQIDCQNDDDGANSQPSIQARRRDVIKAHPPASVLVPDVFVEDVAHEAPSEIVERSSRRDVTAATEDEGSGEIAEIRAGKGASEEVEDDWCQCAGHPEPLEVGVDGARGEDALRTDETPDDGSVEEDATVGAIELVDLVLSANIRDGAAKGPFEDCNLDDASPESGDSLRHEHGTPWDLHVLA